ncbi:MAG: pyridoxamine 5'-phosphate oxidase family protein [Acidimicrobiales bacterium]
MLTDDQGMEILDEAECRRLLGTSQLGRVGLTVGEVPAVFPVNYCFSDEAIWFLTGPGVKLQAAEAGDTVAFEVDEVDERARDAWSVLVIGTSTVATGLSRTEHAARVPVLPWTAAERNHLVRIGADFVSGRRISQSAQQHPPRE